MNTFLLIFVVAAVVWTVVALNRLVARRNLHRSAWSDIDVQLLRRHELVPQLVDVVRRHAAHERDTLALVADLRSRAMQECSPTELGRIESAQERIRRGICRGGGGGGGGR